MLQPHNILIRMNGNGELVAKIGDLGTALFLLEGDDVLSEPCGTSGYIGSDFTLTYSRYILILISTQQHPNNIWFSLTASLRMCILLEVSDIAIRHLFGLDADHRRISS